MSELKRQDIISDDALKAPYELAAGFETVMTSLKKVIDTAKESEKHINMAKSISETRTESVKLNDAQKELEKVQRQLQVAQSRNNAEYQKAAGELQKVRGEQRQANTTARQAAELAGMNAQEVNKQNASLKQLRAAIAINRKEFDNMSAAQRDNTVEGQNLLKVIQQQDADIKELAGNTGRFQDNVGDYKNSVVDAFRQMGISIGNTKVPLAGATKGINTFGTAMKAIPIFLVIGAITSLLSYFKRTEAGAQQLRVITAGVSQVFENLKDILSAVGGALANLSFESAKNGFMGIGDAIRDFLLERVKLLIGGFKGLGTAIELLFKGEFKEAAKEAGSALLDITRATNPIAMGIEVIGKAMISAKDAAVDFYNTTKENVKGAIDLQRQENKLIVDKRNFLIQEAKLQRDIAEQREIAADQDVSTLERMQALEKANSLINELESARIDIKGRELRIAQQRAALSDTNEATLESIAQLEREIIEIQTQALDQQRRITSQRSGFSKQLQKEEEDALKKTVDDQIKSTEDRIKAKEKELQEEITLIRMAAINREITLSEAEERITQRRKDASKEFAEFQFAQYQELLQLDELTGEQRVEIEGQIYTLKTKAAEEFYKHLKDIQDENNEESEERLKQHLENVKAIYSDFAGAIGGLFNAITARRIENIEAEAFAEQQNRQRLLTQFQDDENAKQAIEEQSAIKQEELRLRRLQEERKAAIFEKAIAIGQAGINTALAITKVIPNPVLIALAASLGAIQIATIAATPIPQYADGIDSHSGGLAILGDGGKHEIVKEPGKRPYISAAIPTLYDLPKGTEVLPDANQALLAGIAMSMRPERKANNQEGKQVINELRQLQKVVKNKKEIIVNGSISGYKVGDTRIKRLNRYRNK